MDTGVARKPVVDMPAYREQLRSRRDPVAGVLAHVFARLRREGPSAWCSTRAKRSR